MSASVQLDKEGIDDRGPATMSAHNDIEAGSGATASRTEATQSDSSRTNDKPLTMSARLEQLRQQHKAAGGSSTMDAPRSTYYTGPPGKDSVFGTAPSGVIGRDLPRAVIRVERDYTGGELCQFHPTFPLELEGRIRPVLFSETINDLNSIIIEANNAGWACFDNTLAVMSLYVSTLLMDSRYQKHMKQFYCRIDEANKRDFNPAGLHIKDPRDTAFLFLEVEYY